MYPTGLSPFIKLLKEMNEYMKQANIFRYQVSFFYIPPINPLISRDFSILIFASGPVTSILPILLKFLKSSYSFLYFCESEFYKSG